MFHTSGPRYRVPLLLVLIVSLALFAGACGGEPEPTAPPATATPAPTDTPKPPPTSTPAPTSAPPPTDAPATSAPAAETGDEPSLMDIDINRAPGHSIGFEGHLDPGGSRRFLFLGSQGDTVGAGITSDANLIVGIQDTGSGDILGAVPANDDSLVVTIPQNQLYHIVIEDTGGAGGDYLAAFEGSAKVSFALDADYIIIGRLPEGGLLYYTFSGLAGEILRGNAIPHPETPIDLVVRIHELESQEIVAEFDESGPDENEQFAFTLPDDGSGNLLTYIVSIQDVDRQKGAYMFVTSPALSPEGVVLSIFEAARTGDFTGLAGLCDPLGENDGDTQMICDLATDDTNREEFIAAFSTGTVIGDAVVALSGDRAEVPFLFGPDGDEEETMELVKRNDRWYLLGF